MEYSFRRDKTTRKLIKASSMDEFEFRQLASEEGIELPKDDSTTGYLRALVVKSKIDDRRAAERRKFYLKMTAYVVSALGAIGGAYAKFSPAQPKVATVAEVEERAKEVRKDAVMENTKRGLSNSAQIEKLGGFVVDLQETQVQSVDYIVKQIRAGKNTEVERPPGLKNAEDAVKSRKKKAETGRLLALTPDELDAIDEAAREVAEEDAAQ